MHCYDDDDDDLQYRYKLKSETFITLRVVRTVHCTVQYSTDETAVVIIVIIVKHKSNHGQRCIKVDACNRR